MVCLISLVLFSVGRRGWGTGVIRIRSVVMHKFREDREGVARRFEGRQTNGKLC